MKITKILSALAAIIMLAAGACSDEVKYDPAPAYTGDEVYFKLDEIGTLMIEPQATSVSFHLYRVNKNGELTVGLESTVTNPSGESVAEIFNVPTSVTFPDGQNAVEVPVGIVFSAVTAEMKYTLDVKIVGEEQTPTAPPPEPSPFSTAPPMNPGPNILRTSTPPSRWPVCGTTTMRLPYTSISRQICLT